MIIKDPYWFNIIPTRPITKKNPESNNIGKWMCFGSKEEIHLYLDLMNTLVEDGTFRSVKVSTKEPATDLFPHKECVMCIFTSNDEVEKDQVKKRLRQIGLDPKVWKSDNQTKVDWTTNGKLFQEAEITKKKKILLAKKSEASNVIDTFLCHNSSEKPKVKELAAKLQSHGISVWLDEWNLVPGRLWQEALESVIESISSALILVGSDGFGPWQDREMRAFLSEFVNRDAPVIPVLLPGAPSKVKLPIFLKQFTWVDLRDGLSKEGINKIVWGITGTKPLD